MATHVLKVTDVNDERLDVYLARNLPQVPSRSFVKKLIDDGHVKVNERLVKAHYKVTAGEDVLVHIPDNMATPSYVAPENIPLNIFYEDQWLIVINKASGMLVHPARGRYTGTLVNALLHHSAELSDFNDEVIRPGIVHRLDEDTSGVLVIAKDNITHTRLAKQFQRHTIFKCYLALVEGVVEFDQGKIDAPLGKHLRSFDKKAVRYDSLAKESLTYYQVIRRGKAISLVALYPRTGRTHQLRVHMRHLGHPILGDEKYGRQETFPRLALHAKALGFVHPYSKQYMEFQTKTPPEFLKAMEEGR
jgi:23S rRNA pseudouridine1911/1915/1917 synthase